MSQVPNRFRKFTEDYPEIVKCCKHLGIAFHNARQFDEKTIALSWIDNIIEEN